MKLPWLEGLNCWLQQKLKRPTPTPEVLNDIWEMRDLPEDVRTELILIVNKLWLVEGIENYFGMSSYEARKAVLMQLYNREHKFACLEQVWKLTDLSEDERIRTICLLLEKLANKEDTECFFGMSSDEAKAAVFRKMINDNKHVNMTKYLREVSTMISLTDDERVRIMTMMVTNEDKVNKYFAAMPPRTKPAVLKEMIKDTETTNISKLFKEVWDMDLTKDERTKIMAMIISRQKVEFATYFALMPSSEAKKAVLKELINDKETKTFKFLEEVWSMTVFTEEERSKIMGMMVNKLAKGQDIDHYFASMPSMDAKVALLKRMIDKYKYFEEVWDLPGLPEVDKARILLILLEKLSMGVDIDNYFLMPSVEAKKAILQRLLSEPITLSYYN